MVSYTVAQRTNEFGIRTALGAPHGRLLRIVFSSILASVGGGIVIGLLLTVTMNRVLGKWTEGQLP